MSEQLIASRYILGETLGQGGMGIVYRASDRLTGETVALKQVLITPADPPFMATTARDDRVLTLALEFRTLAGLRHPHIVTVLDYGFDQRLPFLTMQLIVGRQTLSDYGAAQDQADKVRLLIELLEALAYLHRRGVIHRDLKPSNVLISYEGVVKVMDFGLALTHNQPSNRGDDQHGPAGTLTYMASELLLGQQASIQSDLYSVGIMAYDLFAGSYPYEADSAAELMTNILQMIPDTSPIDPALAQVVDRLLAKNPLDRFDQAREVIEALCMATGQPLPPESDAVRESFLQASSFVGRAGELATLTDAFSEAAQGEGSAWLVGGESGVGKSRLLDELQTRVLVQDALVLRGQAIAEGGPLFQVWRDLLRRLAITIGLSDLEAGILKQIIPDVPRLLGRAIQDVPPLEGEANIDRLAVMMVELVSRACRNRPVVMLLEDLQWADESLRPLRMLARVVAELPLLIVCTYRDDERPKLPQEMAGMQVLALTRLSSEAIRQSSESMLGEAGQRSDVLELLTRESEAVVHLV